MPDSRYEPRIFEDTTIWIKQINREWQFRAPVPIIGSITPDTVEAASGHCFVVTLSMGPEVEIPAGGHITLEIPATWEAHLGNCFRRGVRTVGSRSQIMPGYGAISEATCSSPDVRLDLAASYGRILDLLDIVIVSGAIGPGDQVRILLGTPDSSPVQVQKHAQVAILPVGVDVAGDGAYRQVQQHPALRVVGASADRYRVYAPAIVEVGEAVDVRVLPVDLYSHNPASDYRGVAHLHHDGLIQCPTKLDLDTAVHPLGAAIHASVSAAGVHRITAVDQRRGISGRSNPIQAVDQARERVYFGELHSQMWYSMGTGTTAEFFEWGRDIAGLDFCAPANHFAWRFEVTDPIWDDYVSTINSFNQPGRFATLISYEWGGSGSSGHKNVYFRDDQGEFSYWYRGHPSPADLWSGLGDRQALTIPHHTKAFRGVDWSYRDDRHQRLVEICSKWGISEEGGDHSVQAALAMGHRLGFVGGTDSHYGLANQGSYHVNDGNGLACVLAPELTRDALWQALYDRRCYATTGDRILLEVSLDGHPMGSDLVVDLEQFGARHLHLFVAGTDEIERVEVLRNNQVVHTIRPRAEEWEGDWADETPLVPLAIEPTFSYDHPFVHYYVRVTQTNRQKAWSSPIWLTQCPLQQGRASEEE